MIHKLKIVTVSTYNCENKTNSNNYITEEKKQLNKRDLRTQK